MSTAPPASPPDVRRWFFLVVVGIVLYAALDVVAQLLPPHYSAISQAESDLAVGPYGYIMTVNFVIRGLLSLLFLYALARTISSQGGTWRDHRAGFGLLGVWGVGALLLAIFPTDVPPARVTGHGEIHLLVALVAFVGGGVGAYLLARGFDRSPLLRPARGWAGILGGISVLLLAVDLAASVSHRLSGVSGLTERLFLGSVLLWLLLVSLYLLRTIPRRATSGPADAGPSTN
jgi:hypothetical membrane protein